MTTNWNRDPRPKCHFHGEAMVKRMEIQNAAIKAMIQDDTERMKKATDKIFELELKISGYETGYVAPKTVKI